MLTAPWERFTALWPGWHFAIALEPIGDMVRFALIATAPSGHRYVPWQAWPPTFPKLDTPAFWNIAMRQQHRNLCDLACPAECAAQAWE